ncbi:MAG: hypothetical protein P8Q46_02930 [Candidatus Thalassarchaeaceae archaeon]|nr:hypothetical protein [Candidatus Thalassarchaeaceae archaeon]
MEGKLQTLLVSALLFIPLIAPTIAGEWGTDTWLSSVISEERLASGDEFGCQGYEGIVTIDEPWVIAACKEYLEGQTNASRWGNSPISFGIDSDVINAELGASLKNSGFQIVGDMVEEAPEGLSIANRNGASLEKGVADKSLIESAEEDSLVSVHWRARIGDLRVREDKEVISWIEQQPVWFTTWGEWHNHRESGISTTAFVNGSTITIDSSPQQVGTGTWSVPGTVMIAFESTVADVSDSEGKSLPLLTGNERKLVIGWRHVEGGIIVTQYPHSTVIVELETSTDIVETTPMATFNDLDYSITIVGHHTTNLFRWTQDFSGTELTFTWLVERPTDDVVGWKLPLFALTMLIAVPLSIVFLLRNDQFWGSRVQDH